ASAYYSFWDPNFSPATFDWENNSRLILAADANGNITGNEVRIVTHRLCESPGLSVQNVLQKCVVVNPDAVSGRAGGSKGGGGAGGTGGDGGGYSSAGISEEPPPYYRVTARVRGPRNTISYTQVIMY
ncbi:MAG: hypothetical protein JNL84_14120, partial [Candidatus Accumulibacter sp.]|nr:hypothetical protein [Accumulibacter sp.]